MTNLLAAPALAHTAMADGAVTAIRLEGGSLFVQLELPILPGHPHYAAPPRGERHCLLVALLCFRRVRGLALEVLPDAGIPAADGSVEYGGIDRLTREGGQFTLSGAWGALSLNATALEMRLEGDGPDGPPRRLA